MKLVKQYSIAKSLNFNESSIKNVKSTVDIFFNSTNLIINFFNKAKPNKFKLVFKSTSTIRIENLYKRK